MFLRVVRGREAWNPVRVAVLSAATQAQGAFHCFCCSPRKIPGTSCILQVQPEALGTVHADKASGGNCWRRQHWKSLE